MKKELLSRGHEFAFYQAVRLLRLLHAEDADPEPAVDDSDQALRVRPKLSLGFPAADIDRIESVEDEEGIRYEITANFLGLYGTASPLPTFYTEDLLNEAGQDESVSRDFIDIFNRRLYQLLYRAWMRNRLFLQVAEEKNPASLERLYCLLGLGHPDLRRDMPGAVRLLRYIGLLTKFPRSAAGLAALLRDALDDVPVAIVPCIARMARIPEDQRMRLGRCNNRLGMDSIVGEEIEDRMSKFRIRIGPLKRSDFLRFTPGRSGYDLLVFLSGFYITEPLACEVELVLAAGQARTMCLGDPSRSVLGVTSWVFSEQSLGEVRSRFDANQR